MEKNLEKKFRHNLTTDNPDKKSKNYIGTDVLKYSLDNLPSKPGIYRMLDNQGDPLYIGKAKNIKKRVSSYLNENNHSARLILILKSLESIDITVTKTELEALLLESNLIKKQRPRFNILLRDDKSFPYIVIRKDHKWPQLAKHRGAKNNKNEYFGPYVSANAVNQALSALQKAFPLRSCSDSILANRSRPCLQYQIKRCTAPCVNRIDKKSYEFIVKQAQKFLNGYSTEIQKNLSIRMTQAANDKEYETAARYRDRLQALTYIQSKQSINIKNIEEADILAIATKGKVACIQIIFFRSSQNYGTKSYFPSNIKEYNTSEILSAFITQFYERHKPPKLILTNVALTEKPLIEKALTTKARHSVSIKIPKKGVRLNAVNLAIENAKFSLKRKLLTQSTNQKTIHDLTRLLGISKPFKRIEVYDNSHTSGSFAVGAMIVFGPEGFIKNQYRKFNFKENISKGDDYGMLQDVLNRRFNSYKSKEKYTAMPDLIIVDGGKGQLNIANKVLKKFELYNIIIASIAKNRKDIHDGESIYLSNGKRFEISTSDSSYYFFQRVRDEAHRFAITTHRKKRSKETFHSPLEKIQGVGPSRKKALLHHFGSAKKTSAAGLNDLEKVPGINKNVARKIYEYFHDQ